VAPPRADSLWNRLRWLILLLGAVLAYGVAGYVLIEGWSFVDALYMTVLTLSTVGLKEVRPLDTSGKAFTVSLMVMGVGLVLVTLSLTARWVAEGQLGARGRRRRMQRRIDNLTDHFIICAYGRVGRAAAREFEAEGVPFVVIDPQEGLEERMAQDGVFYITEDPSLEPVLLKAGVTRARGLVCAVDSDATNVYITLLARSLNPGLFIVARASEPGSAERLLRAGADRVVSPFVSSGRHMALVALRPRVADVVEVESPGASSLRLEEVRVDPGSSLADQTIARSLGSAPVLAIRHSDGQVTPNPAPDLILRAGDLVLLLGQEEKVRRGAR